MLTSAKRPVRNRVVSSYSSPCIANMADRLFLHHCSHGITGFPSPLPDNNGRLHSDDPSHEPNMIRLSHVTYIHACKVFDVRNNHGEALRHINFNKAPELCIYIDLNRIVNDAYHVCMSPSSFCRVIIEPLAWVRCQQSGSDSSVLHWSWHWKRRTWVTVDTVSAQPELNPFQ